MKESPEVQRLIDAVGTACTQSERQTALVLLNQQREREAIKALRHNAVIVYLCERVGQ